jgi:hypothetical protein
MKIGQLVRTHYMMFSNEYFQPQNIYITSDEEIKEGDYYYLPRTNSVYKCNEDPTELNLERRLGVAKIILTDNPDLIADGVQAITDEFLEWFVKNPSCEMVDLYRVLNTDFSYKFRIIIPKEEPKQIKCYCGHTITCDCEPLQETLEEAAEKHFLNSPDAYGINEECRNSFIEGAKWQQERSYSEEEVDYLINLLKQTTEYEVLQSYRDKVEQFKKK